HAGRERVHHDRGGDGDDRGIENRARAYDVVSGRLAGLPKLDVVVGVVGNETRRPAEPGHHAVTGVDTEPALDAAEIGSTADVDTGRADIDALIAIDAVARRLALAQQRRVLLDRAARLAAVIAVGDVERMLVGERGLDARPRTHIETDLLAHMT